MARKPVRSASSNGDCQGAGRTSANQDIVLIFGNPCASRETDEISHAASYEGWRRGAIPCELWLPQAARFHPPPATQLAQLPQHLGPIAERPAPDSAMVTRCSLDRWSIAVAPDFDPRQILQIEAFLAGLEAARRACDGLVLSGGPLARAAGMACVSRPAR